MAIPTSRTKEKAEISIDNEKCNGCGLCISVCKDFSLEIYKSKVRLSESSFFGCIGCGHCMAICPNDAIEVRGRFLSPENLFDLPPKDKTADYDQLLTLFKRRRSVREFLNKPVEETKIKKIIDAAKTAPMGLPPSDVNVLVLNGKSNTRIFAYEFCEYLDKMKWIVSNWFLTLMRPIWGKETSELFKGFLKPLFGLYTDSMKKGTNLVNYDAPLSMYFYGSPYCDPADPIIAATYAMIAAESLGLGTCMIGGVHPFIQSGKKADEFRKKHEIKFKCKEGLFVIFGYPEVKYKKGIERDFASVSYYNS